MFNFLKRKFKNGTGFFPHLKVKLNKSKNYPKYITVASWKWNDAILSNCVRLKKFDLTDKELLAKYQHQRIYQYCFPHGTTVSIIPEPTNPHDKNALMVVIGGLQIGYIYRDDHKIAHAVMNDPTKYFSPYLIGGNYKFINGNSVEYNHDELGVRLYIDDINRE